jgi:hypothetical protein
MTGACSCAIYGYGLTFVLLRQVFAMNGRANVITSIQVLDWTLRQMEIAIRHMQY